MTKDEIALAFIDMVGVGRLCNQDFSYHPKNLLNHLFSIDLELKTKIELLKKVIKLSFDIRHTHYMRSLDFSWLKDCSNYEFDLFYFTIKDAFLDIESNYTYDLPYEKADFKNLKTFLREEINNYIFYNEFLKIGQILKRRKTKTYKLFYNQILKDVLNQKIDFSCTTTATSIMNNDIDLILDHHALISFLKPNSKSIIKKLKDNKIEKEDRIKSIETINSFKDWLTDKDRIFFFEKEKDLSYKFEFCPNVNKQKHLKKLSTMDKVKIMNYLQTEPGVAGATVWIKIITKEYLDQLKKDELLIKDILE